jgi:hypothetical protein
MIVLSALGTLSALTVVSVEGGLAMTGNDRFHAIAVYAADFNGDGWDDDQGTLVSNLATDHTPSTADGFGTNTSGGLPVFAYADVDGDGKRDPIAGTLAARTDSTTRMVLFFGTGGIESVPATSANAFFAIYADTGAIRSKVLGTCNNGTCEKFYGGVVVTPQQVLFTKTVDPAIGTSACDTGSSTIAGVELNPGTGTNFASDFNLAVSSAVMGGLFGDAGAIYFATLAGDVGTPRTATAGGDTLAGRTQGMGPGDQATGSQQVGTTSGFTLMGWRVVL